VKATLTLHPDFTIGTVDPRLYGGFVEHMGRCVYTGIFEPGHPTADSQGFRGDVADLVRGLGMPVMRYPGGNFVSQYNWEDGIGPRAERPTRLDLAWKAREPNEVGVDEYVDWCRLVGTEPIMAVNLGTRGPQEARDLVEYCNFVSGSEWSDRRAANGHRDPHAVHLWCLGNEMDGPWQACAKTPTEYGRIAREAAKLMRWVDPSIELVVCGSSNEGMQTFGEWEWEVLHHTYDQVDHLAIHSYFSRGNTEETFRDYLASPEKMARFIRRSVALCDAVGADLHNDKPLQIAYDEWNVVRPGAGSRPLDEEWTAGRHLAELTYDVADAVVFGGLLIALLNHSDRVRLGCLAQTVNVLGPIMTEPGGPAWAQTIYHPFALTSRYGRGTVMRTAVRADAVETATCGEVPSLISASVWDEESSRLCLLLANRDAENEVMLTADVSAFGRVSVAETACLWDADSTAANTAEAPDRVVPSKLERVDVGAGRLEACLPALSWSLVRLRVG